MNVALSADRRQGEDRADPSPLLQGALEMEWTQLVVGTTHQLSRLSRAGGLNPTPARARLTRPLTR